MEKENGREAGRCGGLKGGNGGSEWEKVEICGGACSGEIVAHCVQIFDLEDVVEQIVCRGTDEKVGLKQREPLAKGFEEISALKTHCDAIITYTLG